MVLLILMKVTIHVKENSGLPDKGAVEWILSKYELNVRKIWSYYHYSISRWLSNFARMWAEFCSHCGQNLGAAGSKHFHWYTSSHFLKICCLAESRYPLCSQKFTKNSDRNHSKPSSTLTIFDWSLSDKTSFGTY